MKTTVTIEIEVEVEFGVSLFCKGSRDSLCGVAGAGPPLEPDTPAELEDITLEYPSFDALDKDTQEHIKSECWNSLAEELDK